MNKLLLGNVLFEQNSNCLGLNIVRHDSQHTYKPEFTLAEARIVDLFTQGGRYGLELRCSRADHEATWRAFQHQINSLNAQILRRYIDLQPVTAASPSISMLEVAIDSAQRALTQTVYLCIKDDVIHNECDRCLSLNTIIEASNDLILRNVRIRMMRLQLHPVEVCWDLISFG